MREWLSGGAPPCQGGGRGFDPRLALFYFKKSNFGFFFYIIRQNQTAYIAAPGVTRFVGAGGMEAARAVSEEMAEIYLERNMQLQIPGWDFQGACLGLDIRRVVETGITPLINTGIAHKEAGIGQIGAGTVRAPLACFEQALEALAESMGIG